MNKIDKIFHQKLVDHSTLPPALAWGKLENQMKSEKKSNFHWKLGIAASLFILMIGGIYYKIAYHQKGTTDQLAHIDFTKSGIKEPYRFPLEILPNIPLPENHILENKQDLNNETLIVKKATEAHKPTKKAPFEDEVITNKEMVASNLKPHKSKVERQPSKLTNKEKTDFSNIEVQQEDMLAKVDIEVIYKPSPVNIKDEVRVISVDHTLEEENEKDIEENEKTKIQKILAFAGDLKVDLGLAKLREAKEDLFAIDLQSNKKNKSELK